jgi:hypothetical protein
MMAKLDTLAILHYDGGQFVRLVQLVQCGQDRHRQTKRQCTQPSLAERIASSTSNYT